MSARTRLVIFLAMLCLPAAPLLGQQTPEELLQSALYKQQIEGDLGGAIEILRALVNDFSEHRAVAARALVQLGLAHETMGSAEAARAYRRVLSDYPEQQAAVEEARARLATLTPTPPEADAEGLVARHLWYHTNAWIRHGALSPDGRSIAYVDWGGIKGAVPAGTGWLVVHDTRTGNYRVVARSLSDTYIVTGMWSKDGRRLAYSIWDDSWDHQNLHVVNSDGSDDRVITANQQHKQILPGVWSVRGDFIVSFIVGWDDVRRIGVVSVDDGSVRILKTLRGQVRLDALSLSLSPDDRYVAYAYPDASGDDGDLFVLAVDGSGEERVAPNAAKDSRPYWTPDGGRIVFLSDRSGRTGLWAVEVVDGRAASEPELIRPDVGPIVPLGFTEDGALSYLHRVFETDIHIARIDWEQGSFVDDGVLSGRFVGTNSRATWSPDGSRIAYLSQRAGSGMRGASYLVVKSLQDGTERDIELTMQLTNESRPEWSTDGRYVLLNGNHVERTGPIPIRQRRAAYRIDIETGEVRREPYIRDYAGFFGTSSARFASGLQSERLRSMGIRIMGQRDHSAYRSGDEPLRSGESLLFVRNVVAWVRSLHCDDVPRPPRGECGFGMMLETVADLGKMWGWELSPDATMLAYAKAPDMESSPDVLWVWPLSGGEQRQVARVGEGEAIRAVRWTPDGRHLLFATQEAQGEQAFKRIVRVALNGGPPEPMELPIDGIQLGELTFEPNGTRVAYPVSSNRDEVWTLSGFPWDRDRE